MANKERGTAVNESEALRRKVEMLVGNFEAELRSGELRPKVLALVPIFRSLRISNRLSSTVVSFPLCPKTVKNSR